MLDRMVASLDIRSLEKGLELPSDDIPRCAPIRIVREKHKSVRGYCGISFPTPLIDGHRRFQGIRHPMPCLALAYRENEAFGVRGYRDIPMTQGIEF